MSAFSFCSAFDIADSRSFLITEEAFVYGKLENPLLLGQIFLLQHQQPTQLFELRA
jgi:hypothetical protein